MFHIALYQPEIPPNTGNLIRLCANTGFTLHLIHPLGFMLDEKKLRRAGLDYRDLSNIVEHQDYSMFKRFTKGSRVFACTTKGRRSYADVQYRFGDILLFGPESRGLPDGILESAGETNRIRIPMTECSRSINMANAVAIVAFEAWRQNGFEGAV